MVSRKVRAAMAFAATLSVMQVCTPVNAAPELPARRTSVYVPVRDGTRLAVDIFRPASAAKTPAPVILTMTPYQRARRGADGKLLIDGVTRAFLAAGYVVAIGDVRGKGASFGSRKGPSDALETSDVGDVIEWLARQPWSNGHIGMHGCSYLGSTVMEGLRSKAPHLKAVAVGSTQFDMMTSFTDGGATRLRPLADEALSVDDELNQAVPVDGDADGALLRSTRADKQRNLSPMAIWKSAPFRDSISALTGDAYWQTSSVFAHRADIDASGAPLFMYGSWHDPFINETINAWHNLKNARNLLLGHGAHCQSPDYDRDKAVVRFFDFWLKGRPNGQDRDPRVTWYLEGGKPGHEWQRAAAWPLPGRKVRYFLGAAGAAGQLSESRPTATAALTSAPMAGAEAITNLSVVRANVDPFSVTFTSPPLTVARVVSGTPVVALRLSADLADYVAEAYLEQVNPTRSPEVIARGSLLASRRKLMPAPYDTGGVPYPSQRAADSQPPAPGEEVELTFGLSPVGRQFERGDRFRLAVTLRGNAQGQRAPATVHISPDAVSWIDIPVADQPPGN